MSVLASWARRALMLTASTVLLLGLLFAFAGGEKPEAYADQGIMAAQYVPEQDNVILPSGEGPLVWGNGSFNKYTISNEVRVTSYDVTVTSGENRVYDIQLDGTGMLGDETFTISFDRTKAGNGTSQYIPNLGTGSTAVSGTVSSRTVTLSDYSASFSLKVWTTNYRTSAGTFTFNFTMAQNSAAMTGIRIDTPPSKTDYREGEQFDPDGMVVSACYDDDSTAVLPNNKLSFTPQVLAADTVAVTVSFQDFTVTQPVTVAACTGISIDNPPDKVDYFSVETFNPAGMVVTAHYEDDSVKALTADDYTYAPVQLSEGVTEVVITHLGFTATQAITVGPAPSYVGLINHASANGSLDYVTICKSDGTPFEGATVTVDGTTINVVLDRSQGMTPTVKAVFALTQVDGLPFLTTGTNFIDVPRNKTNTLTTTISNGMGKGTIYLHRANVSGVTMYKDADVTVNYTIQNNAPDLAEGVEETVTEDVMLDDAVSVDMAPLFTDADNDDLTYLVSVDGAAATAVDANYVYNASTFGTHTLVFSAKDFGASSARTHTITVNVSAALAINVPEGINALFYKNDGFNEDGTDKLGESLTAVRSAVVNGYRLHIVTVPYDVAAVGYRGATADDSLGGMAFETPADGSAIYLREVDALVRANIDGSSVTTDQASFEIGYGEGHKAAVGASSNIGEGALFRYLLVAGEGTAYSYSAIPDESISVNYSRIDQSNQVVAQEADPANVAIDLLSLADIALVRDSFVAYETELFNATLSVPEVYGACTYEVAAESAMPAGLALAANGKISGTPTEKGEFETAILIKNAAAPEGVQRTISFTVKDYFEYIGVRTEAKVYDNWEHGQWMNAQQVKLNVGDTWQFWPKRVPFIGNDGGWVHPAVIYPAFNIEKVRGDSIDIPAKTETHGYSNRNGDINYSGYVAKDSEGNLVNDVTHTVTALNPGTTIVQVTYDEYDISTYKNDVPDLTAYVPKGTFPATPDVNTAYVIFTVGETGTATVTSSIDNWRRYDTVYFTEGETAPYTITASAEGAEKFVVTCNGLEVEGNDDGTYTLPLENRDNIVGLIATDANGNTTSTYRVIAARFIEIDVANKTHPGESFTPGDTATVTFNGVVMPINRIMGFYNPQYTAAGYNNQPAGINYTCDALGTTVYSAKKGQWTLNGASFDVTFDETGEYMFTGSGISLKWWGADLGADLLQPKDYNPPTSGSSPEVGGNFCAGMLPSFTVSVVDKEPPTVEDRDLGTIFTGDSCSFQLEAASHGTGATWALAEGSEMPAGLALSEGGVVSGAPEAAGEYSFDVVATNAVGASEPATITCKVIDKYVKSDGTVYAIITDNYGFPISGGSESGQVMWRAPISLADLAAIDLDDVTLSQGMNLADLKFDQNGDGTYEVTALQLLIHLSSNYYSGGFDSFRLVGESVVPGRMFVASFFGSDANITYSLNDVAPIDSVLSEQEGSQMGATMDRYVLSDGDTFVFHMQAYEGESMAEVPGNFFIAAGSNASEQGNLVYEYAGKAGEPIDVQVKRAMLGQGEYGMVYSPYADKTSLKYAKDAYDTESSLRFDNLTFDENGATKITFNEPGIYYVWTDDCSPAMAKVTVTQDAAISISEEVSADGVTLPDAELGEAYSVSIGIAGYPTPEVTVTGLPEGLSFDTETSTISGTPVEPGDFTIGITAANEGATAVKELTLKVRDLAAELAAAKAQAIADLNAEFDLDNYSGDDRELVEAALASAAEAIDAAETVEAVESARAAAAEGLSAIKTDAQKAAEALEAAKAQAIADLNAEFGLDNYSGDEKAAVEAALAEAVASINSATSLDAVENAKAAAKTALSAVKTDADKAAEQASQKPTKKANPMKVTAKKVKAKASKLSKKAKKVKATKVFAVTDAVGKVTYKTVKISTKKKLAKQAKKKIKLSSAGKLTLKKGLKKGKYSVKVAVTAAGDNAFNPATKTVTLKVVVK